MQSLLEVFDELCRRSPEHALVLGRAGPCSVARIDAHARALARELGGLGLPPGALVALAAQNGQARLAGAIALRRSACCALLLDSAAPPAERERIALRLGAHAELVLANGPRALELQSELRALRPRAPAALPRAAVLKLTSGSSGEPAGIAVSEAALIADHRAIARALDLRAQDVYTAAVPLTHSYGWSVVFMSSLAFGAPQLPCAGDEVLELAAEFGASVHASVPSWYRAIAARAESGERARVAERAESGERARVAERAESAEAASRRAACALPPSLRLLISAGAPLEPQLARAFRERCGQPIRVLYGSSESGSIACDRDGTAAERGTVGALLEGVELELVKEGRADEGGANPSAGVLPTGRVQVRSPALALGYHRADAQRRRRLRGGAFLSDDLGRLEDGELRLLGRVGDAIVVKGHKVHPRELESVLQLLPGVDEVAVFGEPGADGGERVCAVIACAPGALSALDVLRWCRPRLSAHKLPRRVEIVAQLPRTPRGKLDRAALRAHP
jgi:acyl-CoA synthetase (AMP-forming)/AMP-acid ligase II